MKGESYGGRNYKILYSNCRYNWFPGIKGFTRRGLYRMKRFYEIYEDDEFVTTLLTQISWSNHLAIISKAKTKENENPSVGVILCASKDDEVVEYALSRSLSPTMVSDYTLQLPDKRILRNKLKELSEIVEMNEQ